MLFVEFRFFVFFGVVFLVHWALRSNAHRKAWLLAASYVFYGAWDWRFLSLILASTLVDFTVGLRLDTESRAGARKRLLLASLTLNLGLLAVFKYFNFFLDSGIRFLSLLGIPAHPQTLAIVLPVGISFYTFQTLSYSIDVYRGQLRPTRSPLDFALFVAFFPQLVAGPIVRARDFLPQLPQPTRWGSVRVRAALTLFLIGFFKKACVSDNIAVYVDAYFADPGTFDSMSAWLGTLLYAAQIYCDFSGYSDMAIATAALLGYRLTLNFDFPYFATTITEFWRRWHISLSTWLRDYLYISLGGNRRGAVKTYRNLMLTMLLGGLWHGAAWTFIVWGGMHGLALMAHRVWRSRVTDQIGPGPQRPEGARPSPVGRSARALVGLLLTAWWVNATWIFFRAPDFQTAWLALESYALFVSHGSMSLPAVLWVHLAVLVGLHWVAYRRSLPIASEKVPGPIFAVAYGVAAIVCLSLTPTGYRPFIYFQF